MKRIALWTAGVVLLCMAAFGAMFDVTGASGFVGDGWAAVNVRLRVADATYLVAWEKSLLHGEIRVIRYGGLPFTAKPTEVWTLDW